MAKLIHSAGLAIQSLTNAKPSGDSSDNSASSIDVHKDRFKEATSQYFALLSSIDVRLRRQVYALEEAAVLAPDSTASRTGDGTGAGGGATGGAANPLDISWLNSRKDTVGKDKEAELWASTREFVEGINDGSHPVGDSSSTDGGPGKTENDQKMEVD